ncbi:MAG: radical SAM protein [Polyangiaceae bacterium]
MPEAAWGSTKPLVHSIAIELTAFCNQHCDYCYNAWRADRGASIGTPALDVLLARIDRVLDAVAVEHVTLTGGEPLASHVLFPVLDHLRKRLVRAQLISNGALVTDAIAARLARYRLRSILVTLNGPDAATHETSTGGADVAAARFDDTVGGIGKLRRAKVPVEGSIVITRRNAARVPEIVELFAALGVKKVALSRFSPAGYGTEFARALLPSPAEVREAFRGAAAVGRARSLYLFSTMPIPPCVLDAKEFPEIELHDCPIGRSGQEFALGLRGEVRHCALHRDAIAEDVLDASVDLAKVLGPNDPHRYRAGLPAACAPCEHRETCAGGCGAAAVWATGGMAQDPFVTGAPEKKQRLPLL